MKKKLILLVLLFFIGCQYDPHAHTYTTHKPSIDEITGDYELSALYMNRHSPDINTKIKALAEPPLIHIGANGDYKAVNFPYFSENKRGLEYRFEGFRSVSDKWSISSVGTVGDLSGQSETHYGIRLSDSPLHLSSPGFTGTKQVNGLIFGFSDPDMGEAIIFKKKSIKK